MPIGWEKCLTVWLRSNGGGTGLTAKHRAVSTILRRRRPGRRCSYVRLEEGPDSQPPSRAGKARSIALPTWKVITRPPPQHRRNLGQNA